MPEAQTLQTGHCLCGETQYEFHLEDKTQNFGYCHCRECRRQYGHYAALTGIKSKNFKFVKADHLRWFQSSEHGKRAFCSNCGTPLMFRDDRQEEYFVSTGTINDGSFLREKTHIFVEEKGEHYQIQDDCIQYLGDPWTNPLDPPTEEDLEKARVK